MLTFNFKRSKGIEISLRSIQPDVEILPGMITSGKPSLRVMATPRLKIIGFSLRIFSVSPLSSCREMIRPVRVQKRREMEGRG